MKPAFIFLLLTILTTCSSCAEKDSIVSTSKPDEGVGPPVTRSEMILTADRYARVHWAMSAENQEGASCGGGFLSNYPVGDRIGMGYKWGGWTDIDEFLRKIEDGYGTGTGGGANVYDDFPFDCVVGVSCTGFVSRAWHLRQKYTLCYSDPEIQRKFCEITHPVDSVSVGMPEVTALRKGDVLINEFHTMLFLYTSRENKAMVMDSSYEGVRFRPVTWIYLYHEGYRAIRYDNVVEVDNPAGTLTNPRIIGSDEFPFVHDGNTRDVVCMEFDRYEVTPDPVHSGPEFVYELSMKTPGRVAITVTDVKGEGIDNDVHLLSSLARLDIALMATDCIASADQTISRELDKGLYYIVVDSKTDMPGEYTLTIDLE